MSEFISGNAGIIKESPLRHSRPQERFFDVWEIA